MKSFFQSRKNVTIALTVSGAMLLLSSLALGVMYVREKRAAEELNDRLLLNESRELAFHGEMMLKEGRLADAEKLALSILPKDLSNPDRPYSVDAERLLRNCYMSRNMSFCMIEPEGSVISVDDRYAYSRYSRLDLHTGKVESLCPEETGVTALAPDHRTFIHSTDSAIYALDLQTLARKPLYAFQKGEWLDACTFDQMGSRAVLSVSSDRHDENFYRALYIYEVETGELVDLHTRDFDSDPMEDVDYAFSNDGRWMVEVYEEDGYSGVVSVETWDLTDYSWKFAWTDDGTKWYDFENKVNVYTMRDSMMVCGSNVTDGKMPLIGGLGMVHAVDVNKYTGDILVLHEKDDQFLTIYDENGSRMKEISTYALCGCSFVSQDVIAAYDVCRVYLYDARTLDEIWMFDTGCAISDIRLSEDCTNLLVKEDLDYKFFDLSSYVAKGAHVVVSSDKYYALSNGEVRDARDFELIMTVPASEVMSLAGDFLALVVYDEDTDSAKLQVYDLEQGERTYVHDIDLEGYFEDAITLSPTGRYLAYYSGGSAVISDLSTGKVIYQSEDFYGFSFCEDGVHFYASDWADAHSGITCVMNLNDASEVYESAFVSHRQMVSSTGRFLIDQEDGMIVILETGEKVDVGIQIDKDYYYAIRQQFAFSPSDEFFLLQTEDGVRVYETEAWKVVFEEQVPDFDSACFIGTSYMELNRSVGEEYVSDVYSSDDWVKRYSYEGNYDRLPGLWPTEEHRYGDIEEVWVDNDSRVCMHFKDYDGYNPRGSLLVWDNKAGGFVMSADLPHENDMEIFMTGNGELIFSSYNGVRKVDIPDLQTLIDQTRTR